MGPDVTGLPGSDVQGDNVLCLAPSFSSWLERLRANDWVEYGVVPGEISDLPKAKQAELRRYYGALNPTLNW